MSLPFELSTALKGNYMPPPTKTIRTETRSKIYGMAVKSSIALFGSLAVLLCAAALYQLIASSIERGQITLPGTFVTVNDRQIYVNCQGPSSGDVIILENGMGVVSDNWEWVQRELATDYRVCAYDRAGTGNSEAIAGKVDALVSSDALIQLLAQLNISKPVILVGHSYGALIARVFADRYPDRVAGLVLVDSSHQDMGARFPPLAQEGFKEMLEGFSTLATLNHFSGSRMMGIAHMFVDGLEGAPYARGYHHYASSSHMEGASKEAEGWERSAQAARQIDTLGATPLAVMMVDGWPPVMMPSWSAMQRELSTLSSDSRFVTLKGADHPGAINRAQFATLVVQEAKLIADRVFAQPGSKVLATTH